MNVENVLSAMGVSADVEHTDVSTASGTAADYIITSQELAQSLEGHSARIIVVNNYFDNDEIKQKLEEAL